MGRSVHAASASSLLKMSIRKRCDCRARVEGPAVRPFLEDEASRETGAPVSDLARWRRLFTHCVYTLTGPWPGASAAWFMLSVRGNGPCRLPMFSLARFDLAPNLWKFLWPGPGSRENRH